VQISSRPIAVDDRQRGRDAPIAWRATAFRPCSLDHEIRIRSGRGGCGVASLASRSVGPLSVELTFIRTPDIHAERFQSCPLRPTNRRSRTVRPTFSLVRQRNLPSSIWCNFTSCIQYLEHAIAAFGQRTSR
jgi:hypothetical protein